MATAHGIAEVTIAQAAFRATARVRSSALDDSTTSRCCLAVWTPTSASGKAGFTDATGRFMDRREAATAVGHVGRLESRSYFAGDREPTLEAGHGESFARAA